MKVFKKILLWFAVSVLAMWALMFIPSVSTFVALALIALILPIDAWQEILQRFIKRKLKTVIAIVLTVATLFTVPGIYEETLDTDVAVDVSQTTSVVSTIETTTKNENTTILTTTTAKADETTIEKKSTTSTTQVVTTKKTTTSTKKITTTSKATTTTTKEMTSKKTTTTKKATTTKAQSKITYVLNTKSMKFHYITCHKLPTDNRQDTTLSRDEVIDLGYEPCGLCKP